MVLIRSLGWNAGPPTVALSRGATNSGIIPYTGSQDSDLASGQDLPAKRPRMAESDTDLCYTFVLLDCQILRVIDCCWYTSTKEIKFTEVMDEWYNAYSVAEDTVYMVY